MAFDGIITRAAAHELREALLFGKIEKIYQPEVEDLVFNIHGKHGKIKFFASANPSAPRLHLIEDAPANPPAPKPFCMLLRKHLQGAKITDVRQVRCERIIEISLETLNELGFTVSKKLIFEIMGKHSNIMLVDLESGRIADSIKHVSIDVNRVRQILPGLPYQYPPVQDKIPFDDFSDADYQNLLSGKDSCPGEKALCAAVGGISPAFAAQMAICSEPASFLHDVSEAAAAGDFIPRVYVDTTGVPREFHITPLTEYQQACNELTFDNLSQCLEYYYSHRAGSNRLHQKSSDLARAVSSHLSKLQLKEQRLREDLLKAENSDNLRLYGELLTANIHAIHPGAAKVTVTNYYDGTDLTIPLDPRYSGAKNAQIYFKKYQKARTAIKEKQVQLESNGGELSYLESVLTFIENAQSVEEIDALRKELEETGYLRRRKIPGGFKEKKFKPEPYKYTLSSGLTALAGRNNRENEHLTMRMADSDDLWFHTKDIPGSHVILRRNHVGPGRRDWASEADIYEAASIAAYHSKGRASENVPVDYTYVKYVKKPSGAKPGMVIFTNNKTVWVNPALPTQNRDKGNQNS